MEKPTVWKTSKNRKSYGFPLDQIDPMITYDQDHKDGQSKGWPNFECVSKIVENAFLFLFFATDWHLRRKLIVSLKVGTEIDEPYKQSIAKASWAQCILLENIFATLTFQSDHLKFEYYFSFMTVLTLNSKYGDKSHKSKHQSKFTILFFKWPNNSYNENKPKLSK